MQFSNLKIYQPDGTFRTGSLAVADDRILAAGETGDAVDMESGNAIVPLTVINNPGFDLPKTGGYGTWMFTVGGCMLLGVAAFIVVRGRKHNRNDQ